MRYKRYMIIMVLAVFALSVAGVCASNVDDAVVASEDTSQMGLSASDENAVDNLKTSEENEALASTDYDEAIAQTDTEVLGADSATYSDLAAEISQPGNITLTHKSYSYDGGETIGIGEANKVIDGNGAVIDMAGSTIRAFTASASGVTIKNLTIKNANYNGNGGAIWFSSFCTVTNCNFINNTAANYGGAVYFASTGTVSNCNFTDNKATGDYSHGGAVYFLSGTGTVTNCNFTRNIAGEWGGAIRMYYGTVSNCNFTGNTANEEGGAINIYSGTVSNCNFTGNTAYRGGAVYFRDQGTVSNCNFADNTAFNNGGAVYFSSTGTSTGTVTNCNFADNTASNYGGAVYIYYEGTVTNCNFTGNTASGDDGGAIRMYYGTVSNCNFTDNDAYCGGAINMGSGTVLNCNFADNTGVSGGAIGFSGKGTVLNCNFADNTASNNGGAVRMSSGTVSNCNFADNTATYWGGAIYIDYGTVSSCNFTNNTASGDDGGAIRMYSGTVSNCNFTGNTASGDGGAVYFYDEGSVSNCNFTGNNATAGSAIYFYNASATKTVSNSRFLNNRANAESLEVTKNDDNITITFTGNDNLLNAIYSSDDAEVTFTNVTYWGANGIATVSATMSGSNKAAGQNITVGVVVNGKVVLNEVKVTDDNGMIVLPIIAGKNYYISARHDTDSYYTEAEKTITNNTKFNVNVTSQTTHNKTVNITAKSNIYGDVMPKLLFILPNGTEINATYGTNGTWWAVHKFADYGVYQVNAKYDGLDNVAVNKGTIAVTGPEHTFSFLNYKINGNDNSVIELSNDFYFDPDYDTAFVNGIVINRPVTIKGNGNAIDAKGKARIFNVQSSDTVIENLTLKNANYDGDGGAVYFVSTGTVLNCNFTDNKAAGDYSHGGAVYFVSTGTVLNCNFVDNKAAGYYGLGGAVYFTNNGEVTNCNFTNNIAFKDGGAIRFSGTGTVTNCNFVNNTASEWGGAIFSGTGTVTNCNFVNNTASEWGGAIWFSGTGTVSNCNFTGNNATAGSAIYFYRTSATKTVSNSRFLNNRANAKSLEVTKNDNNITITFTGNDNLLNAIYSRNDAEVTFTNVTYWGANGITTLSATMAGSNKATGQNITVGVVVNGEIVLNEVKVTDENGTIVLPIIAGENYYISARHDTDSYYTEAEKTITNNTKFNVNVTSQTTTNRTVNITAKSNIPNDIVKGKLLFILPNGAQIEATYGANGTWWAIHTFDVCGDYNVSATYVGLDNVTVTNATISISKNPTEITVENATLELIVRDSVGTGATLTPAGAGNLTFTSSNASVVKVEDGKIIAVGEGSAVITVSFAGNVDYEAAENKTITVNVNKVSTEISVLNDTIVLKVRDEIATGATLTPADAGNLTYTVSNSSVVKVEDGKIIALKEGSATITVSFAGDDKYAAAENKTISVTVSKVPTEITVENATVELSVDGSVGIGATLTPADAGDLTYTVSNSSVVKIEDGKIIALKEGSATITVSFAGDDKYAAAESKTIGVTVSKVPTEITVENETVELVIGGSVGVGVTLNPAHAGDVTYTVSNSSVVKVEDGKIIAVGEGSAVITVSFAGDDKYAAAENKTITVNVVKYGSEVIISPIVSVVYPNNVVIKYSVENRTDVSVSIDGVSDDKIIITNDTVTVVGLDAGEYTITIVNNESNKYSKSSDTKTFTVNKQATSIAASDVSTTYNINKDLVITLKDSNGNVLSGVKVTVDLNGAKTYTTDKNGQVKVSTKGLAPKTYTARITFDGNTNYEKSAKNVKVTVKKATPKLTAKKKTFKTSVKTKKYTITLKDNTGKAIKKAKVTLKVKGKTYKATTNSKGKAVFKIKNLKKKGTFKATITYKGNKYYNKVSKKANIKVIVTFKTVSKGSKDKSTVKEIQQALKDHGYYLSYKGHYLKVDGKFQSCTERSVKEFQKDKGLKVTGKVDEKTAKKLGLI